MFDYVVNTLRLPSFNIYLVFHAITVFVRLISHIPYYIFINFIFFLLLAELSMATCTIINIIIWKIWEISTRCSFCLSSTDFLSTGTLFAKQIYSNHTLAWIFPANVLHIFRIPFPKNPSAGLLLKVKKSSKIGQGRKTS